MKRWPSELIHPDTILWSHAGNQYSLIEPIGDGGSSKAFLVVCRSGVARGLPFAVKFFLHDRQDRRDAFLREIAYLRGTPHPAILPVYDYGETYDKKPFYISRHMATTLEAVMADHAVTMLDRLLFASQMCSALSFLAASTPPILHRDIKPVNVFVNGRACVLGDFGMMYRVGDPTVEPDTPMAARTPDLVRHINQDLQPTAQSDIFQLGLLLYRLFSGQDPLQGANSKRDPVLVSPTPVGGDYGPMLNNMLNATLRDEPAQRPTADDLQSLFISLLTLEAKRLRNNAN